MKIRLILVWILLPALAFSLNARIDSLKSALKTTDGIEHIDIMTTLARLLISSDLPAAEQYLREADQKALALNYEDGLAEVWNLRGHIAYQRGDLQTAVDNYDEALKILEKINDLKGLSKLYNNLGLLYTQMGELDKAESYQMLSLKIKRKLDDQRGIASSLVNLGLLYWNKKDYPTAMDYYDQALAILSVIDDKNILAKVYNNIALSYLNLNYYDKSLEYHLKALQVNSETDNKLVLASCYNNIGTTYSKMGQYADAVVYHQKALDLFTLLQDRNNLANTNNNMGLAYQYSGDYARALHYHETALQLRKELNDKAGIIYSLSNLGGLFEQQNDLQKAVQYFQESLKMSEEIQSEWDITNNLNSLGRIYLALNRTEEAEKTLLKAHNVFRKNEDMEGYSTNLFLLAELYAPKKSYQKAYVSLKEYLTVQDTLTTRRNLEKTNELKIKYEMEKKERENELLKKNIEIITLHKKQLVFSLAAALILIALIVAFFISDLRKNQKLKQMNSDLSKAKQFAESHEKQILLINKMLRHDITNNLAVVLSALKLYKKDQQQSLLDEAARKCEAGVDLIRTLHSVEREKIETAKLTEVDVNNILEKMKKNYSEIDINISGSAKVQADKGLESVFGNMIENAILHGNATRIDVVIQSFHDISEIRITNNGKSIDEAARELIFNEHFSTGKNGRTGMGLYIVRENIQRFGGSIYVENIVPQGVTFVINLKKS